MCSEHVNSLLTKCKPQIRGNTQLNILLEHRNKHLTNTIRNVFGWWEMQKLITTTVRHHFTNYFSPKHAFSCPLFCTWTGRLSWAARGEGLPTLKAFNGFVDLHFPLLKMCVCVHLHIYRGMIQLSRRIPLTSPVVNKMPSNISRFPHRT